MIASSATRTSSSGLSRLKLRAGEQLGDRNAEQVRKPGQGVQRQVRGSSLDDRDALDRAREPFSQLLLAPAPFPPKFGDTTAHVADESIGIVTSHPETVAVERLRNHQHVC